MIASKKFVRAEVQQARDAAANDLKFLRAQVGYPEVNDFYGQSIVSMMFGGVSQAAMSDTLFRRVEKIEKRLNRLFDYLDVAEKTGSARTYVGKKQKRK